MGYCIMYLTSTNETAIINAAIKIAENCHLPNDEGTQVWENPTKAFDQDLWFIAKPPEEGWGNIERFTQAEMMADVDLTDIIEKPRNNNWFPPPVPIVG